MNKNTEQMNIYSEDKKEEKQSDISKDKMEKIPYNLHFHILEKFLHNMAGKMNICNFLFEMDADKEEVKKVFTIIEFMLLLYRGILLNRTDINIPSYVFVKLVEDKGGKCLVENFKDFVAEKAFLFVMLYGSFGNCSNVIVGKNYFTLSDPDVQHVKLLISKYSNNVINSRFHFLSQYTLEDNKIIFKF